MRLRRLGLVVILVCQGMIIGCRSSESGSDRAGGSAGAGASPASRSSGVDVPWFAGAAPLLLAPGRAPDRSLIVFADTLAAEPEGELLDSNATFIRLDGSRATGRVAITQTAEGCTEASIEPAPSTNWGVGFIGAPPNPIRVDSIRGMSRTDSVTLTRTAFRLASVVTSAPASRFTGLPFALVDLWRIGLPDGNVAIVATLRRQINQEDSPLEERTFIIAETDATMIDGFAAAYSERASGPEETVESHELLAAVSLPRAATVDLIVAHDFGEETAYGIVERASRSKWVRKWESRRFSC